MENPLPGQLTVFIKIFMKKGCEIIQDDVSRTNIKSDTIPGFPVRDIRKPSQVKAIAIVIKQKLIPDRDQRGALSSQRNIHRPEVTYNGNPGFGGDGRSFPDLGCEFN